MCRPVLDVEVLDNRTECEFADGHEMVGFWNTSVRSDSIPVHLTTAVNQMTWCPLDRDAFALDDDWIKGAAIGKGKSCETGKSDNRALLQL